MSCIGECKSEWEGDRTEKVTEIERERIGKRGKKGER